MPMNPEFQAAVQSSKDAVDPRGAAAMNMFMALDERHKKLFLLQMKAALSLQTAVKS